jgi:hypothetical protein
MELRRATDSTGSRVIVGIVAA